MLSEVKVVLYVLDFSLLQVVALIGNHLALQVAKNIWFRLFLKLEQIVVV